MIARKLLERRSRAAVLQDADVSKHRAARRGILEALGHLGVVPREGPSKSLTLPPTYVAFLDDHVAFYYDELPAGTYDFYFRTRATTPGSFVQPSAFAEMMYDSAVTGQSAGARVKIVRTEE